MVPISIFFVNLVVIYLETVDTTEYEIRRVCQGDGKTRFYKGNSEDHETRRL